MSAPDKRRRLSRAPPLICEQKHLEQMFGTVAEVLRTVS